MSGCLLGSLVYSIQSSFRLCKPDSLAGFKCHLSFIYACSKALIDFNQSIKLSCQLEIPTYFECSVQLALCMSNSLLISLIAIFLCSFTKMEDAHRICDII